MKKALDRHRPNGLRDDEAPLDRHRPDGLRDDNDWIATGLTAFAMTKPYWIATLRSRNQPLAPHFGA